MNPADGPARAGWSRGAPVLGAIVAAVVLLGPALGPGQLLVRDLVVVPDPVLTPRLLGITHEAPRAVPSDAVLALLGRVLPEGPAAAGLLLACLVVAGAGAARLGRELGPAPGRWRLGAIATAVATVWNPWVAEHLAIGQWPLLLGYAALPWLLTHLAVGAPRPALVAVVVLGGLGGAIAWLLLVLGWLGGGLAHLLARDRSGDRSRDRSRPRALGLAAAALVVSAVPWAVPALTRPAGLGSDPQGFEVFAARADLPLGVLVSLLTGGGTWNSAVVPPGRDSVVGSLGALTVLAVGVAGLALVGRRRPVALVAVPALLGLLVALVASVPALAAPLAAVPGGGLLRDGGRALAPWVLLLAVGAGWLVDAIGSRVPAVAALLVLLPVAALPGAAWGVSGALTPARQPAAVAALARAADADPAVGAVAVLPWHSYRRYAWNGDRASLTPWSRLVERRVVSSPDLTVTTADGPVTVHGEEPYAVRVAAALASPQPAAALAAAGVGLVLVDAPGTPPPAGLREVARTAAGVLLRVPGTEPGAAAAAPAATTYDPPSGLVLGADGAALLAAFALVSGAGSAERRQRR